MGYTISKSCNDSVYRNALIKCQFLLNLNIQKHQVGGAEDPTINNFVSK